MTVAKVINREQAKLSLVLANNVVDDNPRRFSSSATELLNESPIADCQVVERQLINNDTHNESSVVVVINNITTSTTNSELLNLTSGAKLNDYLDCTDDDDDDDDDDVNSGKVNNNTIDAQQVQSTFHDNRSLSTRLAHQLDDNRRLCSSTFDDGDDDDDDHGQNHDDNDRQQKHLSTNIASGKSNKLHGEQSIAHSCGHFYGHRLGVDENDDDDDKHYDEINEYDNNNSQQFQKQKQHEHQLGSTQHKQLDQFNERNNRHHCLSSSPMDHDGHSDDESLTNIESSNNKQQTESSNQNQNQNNHQQDTNRNDDLITGCDITIMSTNQRQITSGDNTSDQFTNHHEYQEQIIVNEQSTTIDTTDSQAQQTMDAELYLRSIWDSLKVGLNGYLCIDELYHVCQYIGMCELNDDVIQQLFTNLDQDQDGRVGFDEFVQGLMRQQRQAQCQDTTILIDELPDNQHDDHHFNRDQDPDLTLQTIEQNRKQEFDTRQNDDQLSLSKSTCDLSQYSKAQCQLESTNQNTTEISSSLVSSSWPRNESIVDAENCRTMIDNNHSQSIDHSSNFNGQINDQLKNQSTFVANDERPFTSLPLVQMSTSSPLTSSIKSTSIEADVTSTSAVSLRVTNTAANEKQAVKRQSSNVEETHRSFKHQHLWSTSPIDEHDDQPPNDLQRSVSCRTMPTVASSCPSLDDQQLVNQSNESIHKSSDDRTTKIMSNNSTRRSTPTRRHTLVNGTKCNQIELNNQVPRTLSYMNLNSNQQLSSSRVNDADRCDVTSADVVLDSSTQQQVLSPVHKQRQSTINLAATQQQQSNKSSTSSATASSQVASHTLRFIQLDPNRTGLIKTQDLLNYWQSIGVQNPAHLLRSLGYDYPLNSCGQQQQQKQQQQFDNRLLRIDDLAYKLEDELQLIGSRCSSEIFQVALATTLYELAHCNWHYDQICEERGKLTLNVTQANARADLLALEIDEHHAKLEQSAANKISQLTAQHQEALRTFELQFAKERDQLNLAKIRVQNEASCQLTAAQNEAEQARDAAKQLEWENNELSIQLEQALKMNNELKSQLSQSEIVRKKMEELDTQNNSMVELRQHELTQQIERLEMANKKLRDDNDELSMALNDRDKTIQRLECKLAHSSSANANTIADFLSNPSEIIDEHLHKSLTCDFQNDLTIEGHESLPMTSHELRPNVSSPFPLANACDGPRSLDYVSTKNNENSRNSQIRVNDTSIKVLRNLDRNLHQNLHDGPTNDICKIRPASVTGNEHNGNVGHKSNTNQQGKGMQTRVRVQRNKLTNLNRSSKTRAAH